MQLERAQADEPLEKGRMVVQKVRVDGTGKSKAYCCS